jgi:hypothetical protein
MHGLVATGMTVVMLAGTGISVEEAKDRLEEDEQTAGDRGDQIERGHAILDVGERGLGIIRRGPGSSRGGATRDVIIRIDLDPGHSGALQHLPFGGRIHLDCGFRTLEE